jgi:imidazolonepropionase
MSLLLKNCKALVQCSDAEIEFRKGSKMMELPILEDAYLFVKDAKIDSFGSMKELPSGLQADEEYDASGRYILPAYIDSHTHLVFPESREKEFVLKIKGASYEEIAASGGGILNSANKLAKASMDELLEKTLQRIDEVIKLGTAALEIKSGYGLSVEGELKMLKVIKRLKEVSPIPIKSTFLGAHAVPGKFKNDKKAYIDLIIQEMLPEIEKENLADYIDIFIEKGFYSLEDAQMILEAATTKGLTPRLHVDQMNEMGGIPLAIKHGSISVDHLENTSEKGIEALLNANTIPTLLPSCSFYLNMKYPDARKMIDAGLGISIASDYNPGSSPSGNLNFSMSLACIKMKMMPEEAINAITINAAYALEMEKRMGSISKAKDASLIITKPISSLAYLPYSFGNHVVDRMLINGEFYS